ncbi:MAG: hypothetical protein IJO85_02685 [Lachnospiraceae bacterium]|nr:hypothetical protein [Lachnospiraceae bacterium]
MILEYGETDWLASRSIFYNTRTNQIADNINDLIDYSNIIIHSEGFNNYLRFGFSVMGQTMLKEIKFLLPNQKIYKDEKGKLVVIDKEDPVEKKIHNKSTVEDTFDYMEYIIKKATDTSRSDIILPLSGGYDSRLLAFFGNNKNRMKAFTYGISYNSYESQEVVFAQAVAKKLGVTWKEIELNNYHNYIHNWEDIYGIATHCHGMYQMEFYELIAKDVNPVDSMVLSGIIGDVWAGTVEIDSIHGIEGINNLGYTHGLSINVNHSLLKDDKEIREDFFEKNRNKLLDKDWNVVFTMRNKLILLSYLFKIPQHLLFSTEEPFLDIDLAMKMLNLDWNEKRGRRWQKEFLQKNDLLFDNLKQQADYSNVLDLKMIYQMPLQPLNEKILSELIDRKYIEWINSNLSRIPQFYVRKGTIFDRVHNKVKRYNNSKILQAYSSYLLLKPVEDLLKMRR